MDQWRNRVAVVTGASSGIGAAIVVDLIKSGLKVVGLARRVERIRELQEKLPQNLRENLYALKCDVSCDQQVIDSFKWIELNLGSVDILINNAGIVRPNIDLIDPDKTQTIREVIDINVMGIVYCTREAYASMKKHNVRGHVILINSVAGHIPIPLNNALIPPLNLYPASKYAVTAMTETYRQEFQRNGTGIKITSISPGGVSTEMVPGDFKNSVPLLQPEDISNAILYVLGTPPNVQVHELIIRPNGEKF